MEEQEKTGLEEEDVEGHGRRRTAQEADEPRDEAEGEDDVELHRRGHQPR